MSAEQPVVVSRTRHENGSSFNLGNAKVREGLFSLGAIGVGALGGYFIVDYISKSKMVENFLSSIGITVNGNINPNPEPGTPVDDKDTSADADLARSNFANVIDPRRPSEIFDRTTRVNSYAARKFNRAPLPTLENPIDISDYQTGIVEDNAYNQIVTDDNVYNSF